MYTDKNLPDDFPIDANMAALDAALQSLVANIRPRDSFLNSLDAQIQQESSAPSASILTVRAKHAARLFPLLHRWRMWLSLYQHRRQALIGITTAVAFALVFLVGAFWWTSGATPVNAQQILQKANAVSQGDLSLAGLQSFHFKRQGFSNVTLTNGQRDTMNLTEERWGVLPDRWRTDLIAHSKFGDFPSGSGSDGTMRWSYEMRQGKLEVRIGGLPTGTTIPMLSPVIVPNGAQSGSMAQDTSPCFHPRLQGEATVIGRPAYVIDLGPFLCSAGFRVDQDGTVTPLPPTPPEQQGKNVIWIDKQTFFYLKQESYDPDGAVKMRDEVTEITYNLVIPGNVFSYAPPAGAGVTDLRPKPYTPPQPLFNVPSDTVLPSGSINTLPAKH